MSRTRRQPLARLGLAAAVAALWMPAAQAVTFDFVYYSGAQRQWVYDAAARFTVDVFEDTATPENDVFFRFRNGLDVPLTFNGQTLDHSLSSLVDLQFDTGAAGSALFSSIGVYATQGTVNIQRNAVGTPKTLIDDSGPKSRIAWSGDIAFGRKSTSSPKTDGVNPAETLTLRATLGSGYTFQNVVNAMTVGMAETYVDKLQYGLWTTAEKNAYRAGAAPGLRIALLTQSIVPNTWNPDGHGLFVTNGIVPGTAVAVAAVPEPQTWAMMLAGVGLVGWRLRRRAIA